MSTFSTDWWTHEINKYVETSINVNTPVKWEYKSSAVKNRFILLRLIDTDIEKWGKHILYLISDENKEEDYEKLISLVSQSDKIKNYLINNGITSQNNKKEKPVSSRQVWNELIDNFGKYNVYCTLLFNNKALSDEQVTETINQIEQETQPVVKEFDNVIIICGKKLHKDIMRIVVHLLDWSDWLSLCIVSRSFYYTLFCSNIIEYAPMKKLFHVNGNMLNKYKPSLFTPPIWFMQAIFGLKFDPDCSDKFIDQFPFINIENLQVYSGLLIHFDAFTKTNNNLKILQLKSKGKHEPYKDEWETITTRMQSLTHVIIKQMKSRQIPSIIAAPVLILEDVSVDVEYLNKITSNDKCQVVLLNKCRIVYDFGRVRHPPDFNATPDCLKTKKLIIAGKIEQTSMMNLVAYAAYFANSIDELIVALPFDQFNLETAKVVISASNRRYFQNTKRIKVFLHNEPNEQDKEISRFNEPTTAIFGAVHANFEKIQKYNKIKSFEFCLSSVLRQSRKKIGIVIDIIQLTSKEQWAKELMKINFLRLGLSQNDCQEYDAKFKLMTNLWQ